MKCGRMFGGAGDPTPNGIGVKIGLVSGGAEGASGTFFGHAFDDGVQDEGDFGAWGAEAIEDGHGAGGDLAIAGLTHEIGDGLAFTMLAVMNKSMDGFIGDTAILTIEMGASKAGG